MLHWFGSGCPGTKANRWFRLMIGVGTLPGVRPLSLFRDSPTSSRFLQQVFSRWGKKTQSLVPDGRSQHNLLCDRGTQSVSWGLRRRRLVGQAAIAALRQTE